MPRIHTQTPVVFRIQCNIMCYHDDNWMIVDVRFPLLSSNGARSVYRVVCHDAQTRTHLFNYRSHVCRRNATVSRPTEQHHRTVYRHYTRVLSFCRPRRRSHVRGSARPSMQLKRIYNDHSSRQRRDRHSSEGQVQTQCKIWFCCTTKSTFLSCTNYLT